VIVVSILAAFTLDAWWDARAEESQVHARLQTLETELVQVHGVLEYQMTRLDLARQAVASLLPHVSPQAPLLSPDSLNVLMDLSFRMGAIEVPGGSTQAMFSSEELASIKNPELVTLLATWPMFVERVRTKSSMLEQNRETIIDYLHDRYPTLEIAQNTSQMSRYPRSSFPPNASAVQRDMRVEGLFGNRGMLIEDTEGSVQSLDGHAMQMLTLLRELPSR